MLVVFWLFAGLAFAKDMTFRAVVDDGVIHVHYNKLQERMGKPGFLSSKELLVLYFDDEERTNRLSYEFRKLGYEPSWMSGKQGYTVDTVYAGPYAEMPHPTPESEESSRAEVNVVGTVISTAVNFLIAKALGITSLSVGDKAQAFNNSQFIVYKPAAWRQSNVDVSGEQTNPENIVILNVCYSSPQICSQVVAISLAPRISLDRLKDAGLDEGVFRSLGLR